MTDKTYLNLVNESMAECKVNLDPLTSVNFADPPRTVLYSSFKRWVNKAYRDLMLERPEWFFRIERTTINLYPRLHVSNLTYIPSVGDVLEGAVSGVRFTVKGVHNFEYNEEDTIIERTLDVEYSSGSDPRNFDGLEMLDRVLPTALANVGLLAAAGRYNFEDDVIGLDAIDPNSVRYLDTTNNISARVTFVPWNDWINRYSYYPYGPAAQPEYITQASDGNYEVFPQPLNNFALGFDYSRVYPDMALHNDIPVGVPDKFQDILVWKAVAEFADYDNNAKLYSRAIKNIEKYTFYMNRDTLPKPYIQTYGW